MMSLHASPLLLPRFHRCDLSSIVSHAGRRCRRRSRACAARASTIEASTELQSAKLHHRPQLQAAITSLFAGDYLEDAFSSTYRVVGPLFKASSREEVKRARSLLLTIADTNYTVHSLSDEGDVIKTRWTFSAKLKGAPGLRALVITGTSLYTVSSAGILLSQTDAWDAIPQGGGAQIESLTFLLRNALSPQSTPDLDTPKYTVLRKLQEYEIRSYKPFLVAEVDMPPSSSPAAGAGFNELAGYIFGGNTQKQRMEMTTPVLSTAGQQRERGNRMAFVMESRYGTSLHSLPVPQDSRVVTKEQESCVMAALSFGGLPLDFQVTEAERRLRGLLLLDRLDPEEGYTLARYNSPFEPPFIRRNEILIRLKAFDERVSEE